MNPLRFRPLSGERSLKSSLLHPALAGAAALLCVSSVAFAADAPIQQPNSTSLLSQQLCKQNFNSGDAAIYADNGKLKPDFDPKIKCKTNAGDETRSYNALAVEQTPEILKKRHLILPGDPGPFVLKNRGACRSVYIGIQEVYDLFAQAQTEYCNQLNAAFNEASGCGAVDKRCQSYWETYRDVNRNFARLVDSRLAPAADYLDSLSTAARKAEEKYNDDLSKLKVYLDTRNQTASSSTASPPGDSIPDNPEVDAKNGNKETQTAEKAHALEAYYQLLRGSIFAPSAISLSLRGGSQTGPLIEEEDVAIKTKNTFGVAILSHLKSYKTTADQAASSMDGQIKNIARSGSLLDGNGISNISGIAGVAAPMTKAFNSGNAPAALSGLSQLAGGASSSAPVAEMAAAAGLGALAAHGLDSASRSAPAAAAEAPAAPQAPATPSQADLGNDGGTQGAKAQDHTGGSPLLGSRTDPAPTKSDDPGSVGGGGAGLGEGASRAPSGKRGPALAPAAAAAGTPVDAGGSGTPDGMGSFGTNLSPQPAPKAAAPSAGSEVANLLGQMKNLFNFDENAPGGGMPGAPPIPGIGGAAANDPNYAGGAPGAPDGAPADDTGATAEAGASGASSGDQSEEVKGSPFGKVDTSLFARVRYRHHRCMERGLVLYGLRERVE